MSRYAIQNRSNGQLIDYCDTIEQAQYFIDKCGAEVIEIANASHIVVEYTELGGSHGYGHQEESFSTYGGIRRCVVNLYKWIQRTSSIFGPDPYEIREFFKHCSLYVNQTNKTAWLQKQVDDIKMKELYV